MSFSESEELVWLQSIAWLDQRRSELRHELDRLEGRPEYLALMLSVHKDRIGEAPEWARTLIVALAGYAIEELGHDRS